VLKGITLSARFAVQRTSIRSRNVIGRLDGHTRPDESVIFSAHWDHLGVAAPDLKGDRIYNGAQDNASGVADLIELARQFTARPRTTKTLLFIAFTGEEKGLLGSAYYVQHPLLPLAGTMGVLNIDALDIKGPTHDVSLWGQGRVSIERDLAELAARSGRRFEVNPRFEVGYYFRADHFSFAKAGVPAITLGSGLDLLAGGKEAGQADEEDYFAHRYHHASDEWSADMDFSGQALDMDLYYALGRQLADDDVRPMFDRNSDYRRAQDALLKTASKQ
jgi:Zn-dependent M28 family amino/carboxypeptidase